MRKGLLTFLFILVSGAQLLFGAGSTSIVISQVYGGGGNTGSTFKNDFIELYNLSAVPVNVAGWTVQYASATGATWQTTALIGAIQPGKYYLVQEAVGAGGTVNLPTPDVTGTIAMSATAGKGALGSHPPPPSGTSPPPARIVYFLGDRPTGTRVEAGAPRP